MVPGDATVIHGVLLAILHPQVVAVATVKLSFPPAAAKFGEFGMSEYAQPVFLPSTATVNGRLVLPP